MIEFVSVEIAVAKGSEYRLQVGRVKSGNLLLDNCKIGYAKHGDIAIAPGLAGYPFYYFVCVSYLSWAIVGIFSLRLSGTSYVSDHLGISSTNVKLRIPCFTTSVIIPAHQHASGH
jgi:hypothetical protein